MIRNWSKTNRPKRFDTACRFTHQRIAVCFLASTQWYILLFWQIHETVERNLNICESLQERFVETESTISIPQHSSLRGGDAARQAKLPKPRSQVPVQKNESRQTIRLSGFLFSSCFVPPSLENTGVKRNEVKQTNAELAATKVDGLYMAIALWPPSFTLVNVCVCL